MIAPGAVDRLAGTPGFPSVFGNGEENLIVQQAAGLGIAQGQFRIFPEKLIAQRHQAAVGKPDNLAVIVQRDGFCGFVVHPPRLGPGYTTVGAFRKERSAVHTFKGLTHLMGRQNCTPWKLTQIRECGIDCPQLGQGIFVDDMGSDRFHSRSS